VGREVTVKAGVIVMEAMATDAGQQLRGRDFVPRWREKVFLLKKGAISGPGRSERRTIINMERKRKHSFSKASTLVSILLGYRGKERADEVGNNKRKKR